MAELNTDEGGGKGKHSKKRAKKSSTKVDMTPMVDLAFLLLTFFVLTATFGKPKAMEINMPVDPDDTTNTTKVEDETAMTILLNEKQEKIYYYFGMPSDGGENIKVTDYSKDGLRKVLLDKNKKVIAQVKEIKTKVMNHELADSTAKRTISEAKGDRKALFVIVKTDPKAKYKGVIDVIDELNICDVGKYAIIDMSELEKKLIENK